MYFEAIFCAWNLSDTTPVSNDLNVDSLTQICELKSNLF